MPVTAKLSRKFYDTVDTRAAAPMLVAGPLCSLPFCGTAGFYFASAGGR
jgi:hypothetical protein